MSVIFKTISVVLFLLPVWTDATQHTRFACEHQTPVRVSCPAHYVIDVQDAFYGRLEKDRCGWNKNDHCKAGNSLTIIKKNCQNKNSCVLKAHNSVFGDPCHGVVKYIKLVYQCVPIERVAIACEHEADVTVSCPRGTVIRVFQAFYGRDDLTTCYRYHETNTNCKAKGSYQKIRHACDYKNSCVLWAKNSKFGDPCRGVRKFIKMNYSCIPQYH
ncbi:L-rhamnose-binding lectin CSL3-like [Clavelina lepadiformis]|uniref:L-rhamnose-binding lectin CSL3-like n=1 Tax=Clavelina lepadiformis TaxID=159417 RepID=UPI0040419A36